MLPQKRTTPEGAKPNKSDAAAAKNRFKQAVRGQLIMAVGALLLVAALLFPMSVAWFTNVARTGSLQFQTETWGFDAEKIVLTDPVAVMRPGDHGYVSLSVDNSQGTGDIAAAVYADKTGMAPEMQQRLFFYVDAPRTYTFGEGETIREETADRQYILSAEPYSYSYEIARGECLTLSEEYCSDAPLKWEWVYDMEGYYFLGRVDASGVLAEEYLRPIQYELEKAAFSSDGQLQSIGDVPVAEFLTGVFDADGYEGTFDPEAYTEITYTNAQGEECCRRFYPVAVDENGQGVWVYLCNYDDTRSAQEYDNTQLGAGGMQVKITVSVNSVERGQEPAGVSSAAELLEQLTLSEGETSRTLNLKLTEDLTVETGDGTFALQAGVDADIDLNGYAIFYKGEEGVYNLFTVHEGAKLTLLNGELRGLSGNENLAQTNGSAVRCAGGETVISGIRVRDFDTAVYVDDPTGTGSAVKITGCDLETAATAVLLYSSGAESAARSRVIVQNSTIRSDYIGISGQGSSSTGTELVVLGSRVEGYWAGIYHPQQRSSARISGSTISGYTGLVVKGGTVTVYQSAVTGTGAYAAAAESGSGFADTGGGIYVEAVYPWSATVLLRGTENTVESVNGYGVELFGVSGKGPGRVQVEGGTVSGGMGAYHWNDIGTFTVPTEGEA